MLSMPLGDTTYSDHLCLVSFRSVGGLICKLEVGITLKHLYCHLLTHQETVMSKSEHKQLCLGLKIGSDGQTPWPEFPSRCASIFQRDLSSTSFVCHLQNPAFDCFQVLEQGQKVSRLLSLLRTIRNKGSDEENAEEESGSKNPARTLIFADTKRTGAGSLTCHQLLP